MADLPGIDTAQRRALRTKVRRIVCRPRATTLYLTRIWTPIYWVISMMTVLGALTGTAILTKGLEKDLAAIGALSGVCSTGLTILVSSRLNGRYRRSRLLRIYLQASFLLYFFSVLAHSALKQSWTGVTAAAAAFPMALFIAVFTYSIFVAVLVRRRLGTTGNIYGRAARSTLETAAYIARNKTRWDSSRVSRKAVAAIEDLARAYQDTLALRSRIGLWHADVFSQTATEALRIAHLVRGHKKLIVCASAETDFQRVAESLTGGLTALLENDRATLLANAPEATRKENLKILIKHLMPVVLFTSAAIVLPMIPPISNQEKIAESVRLTLIVAAVLSLVAPRNDSSARILDIVGKAMPSK
ncbi:hypothetical protein ABZ871_20175 [Streptomyces populi]